MFWEAVINGLKVLLHWQTYVTAIMYLIISFLPIIVVAFAENKSDELMTRGGCLAMLLQPLFQSLGVFISVCTLFPIILFGWNEAAWSLPWLLIINVPGRVIILLIIMLVFSIIGALIPLLGRANSFIMFIMGGIVLIFLTMILDKIIPELGIKNIDILPSFLTIIGIVIVSGVASWLGMLASAVVITFLLKKKEEISQLIMFPLGSVFGFIPIFIYGAWLGLQIQRLH
ncbi:MAG: hypothetical protein LWW94_07780 [Candidatus Desulfofervidaceae bacterium]|nr:hypothetical protein [Candidatus Desulfofervidaceae bacterium]